jgi:hypothetical protein
MTNFQIGDIEADVAQFADIIYNGANKAVSDKVRDGVRLLQLRLYTDALAQLTSALADAPDEQELHFSIAIARLGGLRPHRHGEASIQQIFQHLRAAPDLPHALVLELLVSEDHRLYWQRVRSKAIPRHISALVATVGRTPAEMILVHVPAPEARTWRALYAHLRRIRMAM